MQIKKVFIVPHFHFDFEWWKEEPYHEEDAIFIIDKAFEMLRKYPNFTYVIDQVMPLKYYLEKIPSLVKDVKRFIQEGRLELVGGTIVAPDEGLPAAEGLVRQFYEGKKWCLENIGVDIEVAWEIDEFSHPAQMPQILSMLGFKYFVFSRGVKPYDSLHPTLFWWTAPFREKRLLSYWWAGNYLSCLPIHGSTKSNIKRYFKEMRARIEYEGERSPVPYLMIPFGGDFIVPSDDWIAFVDLWNKTEDVQLEFSLPGKYFKLIEKEMLPEKQEEYDPVFNGYFSSREKLKQRCRQLQNRLHSLEKLFSISNIIGNRYPTKQFKEVWWEVLKGDFHDTICGTGTDRVYRKSLERYNKAELILNINEHEIDSFLKHRLDGKNWYAFNSCNWQREEIVRIEDKDYVIKVPPLCIKKITIFSEKESTLSISKNSAENERVRIIINEINGSINIYDKERNFYIFKEWGNELIVEDDVGNLWSAMPIGERYRLKLGGINIVKDGDYYAKISIIYKNRFIKVEKVLVLSSYKKQIDFFTTIEFKGKDKRISDQFPMAFHGEWFGEEPFYMLKKDDGIYPFQNAVLYKNKFYGIGIINRGVPGYQFDHTVCKLILFRSISIISYKFWKWYFKNLFKIYKLVCISYLLYKKGLNIMEYPLYPIHNTILRDWASEGTRTGFATLNIKNHLLANLHFYKKALCWERGIHNFSYSLLLDVKNMDEITRKGMEFNNPLWIKFIDGTGDFEEVKFLNNEIEGIVISALYPFNNGYLLRCYESQGKGNSATFSINQKIKEVYVMKVIGDEMDELDYNNGIFKYEFNPFEIVNFYLI